MKAIGNYPTNAFYTQRQAIIDEMFALICKKLEETLAKCWGLQFTEVSLDPRLESKLLNEQLQSWYVKTKEAEQLVSRVQADTDVIEADFRANISIVTSNADADYTLIKKNANQKSTMILKQAEANITVILQEAIAKAELTEA